MFNEMDTTVLLHYLGTRLVYLCTRKTQESEKPL